MGRLTLYAETSSAERPGAPLLESSDPQQIAELLAARGIGYDRWPVQAELPEAADAAAVLSAYAEEIARVQASGTYPTVDAIRLSPDHPDRVALRQKFLSEHTHAEDEVRFFVEGRGLFCLHLGAEVAQVLCEQGDFLRVPAGTRHWFDMGSAPRFSAIRLFDNPEGWVAVFTGDPIAESYPLLD
ncbi:1,2-dihydroxy-3-keto-5-methylthiopentene dioxygenase [Cyanobium sp. ATX 6F1]|uniref:1,2-dihydroxy-3-keto-5-methylthiopentene dioxygenase n=1 Tax=Cyanobium sp. ATX 6F1 TaxID=2823702 RepID=UPI0020CF5F70|nr:cupin domain-containing protein [Cyanobium sp. ATX 6F1]MCP9915379.1 cupin domain-containing protein [Cyanobium sp. ATX 6F1]